MMRLLFLFGSCLLGALIWGFGGALLGVYVAVATGSEAVWCMTTVVPSLCDAYLGMLVAKGVHNEETFRIGEVVLPALLGVVCGVAGYLWMDWAVSHAALRCDSRRRGAARGGGRDLAELHAQVEQGKPCRRRAGRGSMAQERPRIRP